MRSRLPLPFHLWIAEVYVIMRVMKRPVLSDQEDRARRALRTLMGVLDITDAALAERVGWSRQQIQQRRNGDTRLRLGDVWRTLLWIVRRFTVDACVLP